MPEPVLSVRDLQGFYGESHILQGVELSVDQGEVVTIIGRNGVGKTTTLRAIMGILPKRTGSIAIAGTETVRMAPERIARLGVGYVPEERGIFASLNVTENLLLPPTLAPGGMALDDIYRLFPNLAERARSPGARLSGGEQQMLAIARILRTGAKFLLLDEPTEGLAPVIVEQIMGVLEAVKNRGFTVLLVEQNFRFAAGVADRHYVMDAGSIIDMIPRSEIDAKMSRIEEYLGV